MILNHLYSHNNPHNLTSTNIKQHYINQLSEYFNNIKPAPKFGILTNGLQYKFYASFDDDNRLDDNICFYTTQNHGGSRLDKGRIPTNDKLELKETGGAGMYNKIDGKWYRKDTGQEAKNYQPSTKDWNNTQGRFPANLLTGTDPIDIQEILDSHSNGIETPYLTSFLEFIGITLDGFINLTQEELIAIVERIESPLDVERERKGGSACNNVEAKIFTNKIKNYNSPAFEGGDLSRYLSLTQWTKKNHPALAKLITKTLQVEADARKISPHIFCAKPSKEEGNAGLEGFEESRVIGGGGIGGGGIGDGKENAFGSVKGLQKNTHPTKKPVSLFIYLIEMFSNEHDIVLDPFCGSGVTPIACVLTNRKYIGCEMEEEYHKIAEARVGCWKKAKEADQRNLLLYEDNR